MEQLYYFDFGWWHSETVRGYSSDRIAIATAKRMARSRQTSFLEVYRGSEPIAKNKIYSSQCSI